MIRDSPIAGSWYAGTKQELTNQIRQLFQNVSFGPGSLPDDQKSEQEILGVITPHAGYQYSGSIAAHSYLKLYQSLPDLEVAIIIGPNHRGVGPDVSISDAEAWKTPLGDISIDNDIVDFIQSYKFDNLTNSVLVEDQAHEAEHSIDIQIPFLQYLYDDLSIVPICLKNQEYDPVGKELGNLLKDIIDHFARKNIIVIASTDLSHEYNYQRLESNDKMIVDAISTGDVNQFHQTRKNTAISMCGYGSVYCLLNYGSQFQEQQKVEILKYANSGQVTGKISGYTVGYLSASVIST